MLILFIHVGLSKCSLKAVVLNLISDPHPFQSETTFSPLLEKWVFLGHKNKFIARQIIYWKNTKIYIYAHYVKKHLHVNIKLFEIQN